MTMPLHEVQAGAWEHTRRAYEEAVRERWQAELERRLEGLEFYSGELTVEMAVTVAASTKAA